MCTPVYNKVYAKLEDTQNRLATRYSAEVDGSNEWGLVPIAHGWSLIVWSWLIADNSQLLANQLMSWKPWRIKRKKPEFRIYENSGFFDLKAISYELWPCRQAYCFFNFFLKTARLITPAPNKIRVAGSGTRVVGFGPPGHKVGLVSEPDVGAENALGLLEVVSEPDAGVEKEIGLLEDPSPPPLEPKKPIALAFPSGEVSSKKGENNSMRLIAT